MGYLNINYKIVIHQKNSDFGYFKTMTYVDIGLVKLYRSMFKYQKPPLPSQFPMAMYIFVLFCLAFLHKVNNHHLTRNVMFKGTI